MANASTKKIVLNGLMIAVVFLTTYFTRFPGPIPPGYINLGDAAILVAALLLGRKTGFIAGAVGSALADLAAGAFLFVPVTFIVKGIEGYVTGLIGDKDAGGLGGQAARVTAVVVGVVIMVAGYFVAEAFLLGAFDSTFGWAAARLELPLNLVQGGASAVTGYALTALLSKKVLVK